MLIFTDDTDPGISSLPPPYQLSVRSAIRTLWEIFGHEPDPTRDGFVAFVEAEDTPESLTTTFVRPLTSVESTFRDRLCLVGMILWGNTGSGVTVICPDEEGYAPEVASILKRQL